MTTKIQHTIEDWLGNQKTITINPTTEGRCCICSFPATNLVGLTTSDKIESDRYCTVHSLAWFPLEV